MGIVHETHSGPEKELLGSQWNTIGTPVPYGPVAYPTQFKEQTGYRSGPLSKEETDALFEYEKHSTLGMTRTSVDHLERIMRANNTGINAAINIWGVNERDYLQVDFTPNSVQCRAQYSSLGVQPTTKYWEWVGSLGLMELSSTVLTNRLSETEVRGLAASLIRSSRPTQPSFNLTRFVGELKDANRLFQLPASAGSSAIGQSYLGAQFGWKATADDVKRGAESILKADQKYVKYLEHANRETVVRRTEDFGTESITGRQGALSPPVTGSRTTTVSGLGKVKQHCPMTGASMRSFGFGWYLGIHSDIKAFATYLWFSYDPDEFSNRRQSYLEKARTVLGGGLTLGTAYDLAPFSWMVDWYYDIGGLLAYQQDVADVNLVAKRMGVSYNRTFSVELKPFPQADTSFFKNATISGSAYALARQQLRYSGNPYDMSTTSWSSIIADPFKASILAALGLTKAKNIPFIR